MLTSLVAFSIRFRGVIIALACVGAGYGAWCAANSKFDVYPEFAPPQVVIETEAPGLSPEDVEQLVTRPVEAAVNGVGNLESIRSQSIQGLSVVVAVFGRGTDVFRARQMVAESLTEAAAQMPNGVRPPALAPLTSSTSTFLAIGLTSKERTGMDVRTVADWVVKPRLLGVPGVAKVVTYGGSVRQLQVQVLPERLAALGLGLNDVLAAAANATGVRGAGFIETDAQRIVVETQGQALTPDLLGGTIVSDRQGAIVRLRDVARVVQAGEPKIGDAAVQGEPGVVQVISSQYGANTLEVTAAVGRALQDLKPALDAERITLHPALFRPADFIQKAVTNVNHSLLLGGLFVAVVLSLFLFNARTAFISLTAIPLSLLLAVIALRRLGVTLNTMTLGGLAIAIGEVVDDAVIDVENIFRRLRENRAAPTGRSAFQIVLDASIEVRSSVIYATFVVALVFLPVLTMSGIQGRLFAPLGLAYILAILASLLIALTLTPALSYALFGGGRLGHPLPPYITTLKARYLRTLEALSRRSGLVIAGAVLPCLAAIAALPFFGGAFLPEFNEGHFLVHMSAVPGTSLDESLRLGRKVTEQLLKNPHIGSVAQRAGRAEMADDTLGTHYSEFDVELVPLQGEKAELVMKEIRDALAKFPGLSFAIKPFLTERIEEVISGRTAQVVVEIYGDNLDALDVAAAQVGETLSKIDGAVDVNVESPPGAPRLVVRLLPERLRRYGFQPVEALNTIQTAYQGTPVAQTYENNRVFDVAVILDPSARRDPESVSTLLLRNRDGSLVALHDLAEIYQTSGRYAVFHDGARRQQVVTCNVAGRDVASFVAEARRRVLADVPFPSGVYPVFTGAAEAQAQARSELLIHSLLAGAGVILLLAIVFKNGRNLLLALANLPFALVGGVLAVFFSGGWLSVGSLVGFVTLFGITMRNSIMMVSHFEHLVDKEGMTWGPEAALRGASERLMPILMTATVTALGLLPLALGSGTPGREIEGPMAIVILGGLVTSTALNLLVLPTLALRFGRFEKQESP